MAWRDPWHARYYAWVLPPDTVLAGQVNVITYRSAGADPSVVEAFTVDNITTGSIAACKRDMTVLVGSTAGADDKGRARLHVDGTGSTLYVVAPINLNDGELFPEEDDYVTVLDDYRVWMMPPYASGGSYYYDGRTLPSPIYGTSGTTDDQDPIANGGPGYAQFAADLTGVITVDFDASASFAVADDAVLSGYSADLFGGSEVVTSSSGTAANAVDGNAATYNEFASTNTNEYIQVDWGNGNDKRIRKFSLTVNVYPPSQFIIMRYSDDATHWITAYYEDYPSAFGTPETRTFYNHDVGAHRYWRIYPNNASNGCRVYEWAMYEEDRTAGASPYSWDVGDGTITVGSSTTEAITATFPAGFRWVHLTVTDSAANTHITHIPVLSAGYPAGSSSTEIEYALATFDANLGTSEVPNLYDNDTATRWYTLANPSWPIYETIILPKPEWVAGYSIQIYNNTNAAPRNWMVYADDVAIQAKNLITWSAAYEKKSYDFTIPVRGTEWKINITENQGVTNNNIYIAEVEYFAPSTVYMPIQCAIASHELTPSGQVIELDLLQNLDAATYPDGTLVMVWQDEYYAMTQGSLAGAGPSDREHMVFVGWIDEEPTQIGDDYDNERRTSLRCLDVGQRMAQLMDFSLVAAKDAAPGAALGYQMKHANVDVFIYLMVSWLTTAASLTDFTWSNTADDANFGILTAQGSSIFDMIDQKARCIRHIFTCNKHGQLQVLPSALEAMDRFLVNESIKETLTEVDYTSIEFTRQRTSRYHWLQVSGVYWNAVDADSGSLSAGAYFGIAPGTAPGQGTGTEDVDEQLMSWSHIIALGSGDLDGETQDTGGRRYAQLQAHNSLLSIRVAHPGDAGIDPAEQHIIRLTVPAAQAAQRGQTWTTAEGIVRRISYTYDHENMTRDAVYEWEERQPYHAAWRTLSPS